MPTHNRIGAQTSPVARSDVAHGYLYATDCVVYKARMKASSMSQPWRRPMLTGVAAAGVAVTASHLIHRQHTHQPALKANAAPPFLLPQPFADGLAGAIGEVAQICVLYPLETIKVRCQADSLSAAQVVKNMVATYGPSMNLVRQMYSGFSAAAIFSLAVGAVHWLSFCSAKRAALDVLPAVLPATATKTALASTSTDSATHVAHVHVSSSHHPHEEDVIVRDNAPDSEADLTLKTTANALAAAVGAMCTALVEAPVELFRHQAQAGIISGNLVQEMVRATKQGGPFAIWTGFLPFCLEAFPYDMSELGFYSQLRDIHESVSKPESRWYGLCSKVPEHAWDLAIGGAAGAAAVLIAMPFDCIKTYLQTHDIASMAGGGAREQLNLFLSTGAAMVRKRGPAALYLGVLPRLAQQVPSSTLCWWAVQQTQKVLAPYVKQDPNMKPVSH